MGTYWWRGRLVSRYIPRVPADCARSYSASPGLLRTRGWGGGFASNTCEAIKLPNPPLILGIRKNAKHFGFRAGEVGRFDAAFGTRRNNVLGVSGVLTFPGVRVSRALEARGDPGL